MFDRTAPTVPGLAPLLVAVAALTAACAAPATTRRVQPIDHDDVEILLAAQATAWNAGDLRAFVATYWRDEALTFLGGRGLTRGHERLLADFEKAYPDAETRGRLTFELIEVRPLGFDHALVLGRYRLERAQPDDGTFTLIVARFPEGIRIVHDHSSSSRGG